MTSGITRVSMALVDEKTLHGVPDGAVARMRLLVELFVADGHSLTRETVAWVRLLVKIKTITVCALGVVDEAVAVFCCPETGSWGRGRQWDLLQTVAFVVVSVDSHDAGERVLFVLVGEIATITPMHDDSQTDGAHATRRCRAGTLHHLQQRPIATKHGFALQQLLVGLIRRHSDEVDKIPLDNSQRLEIASLLGFGCLMTTRALRPLLLFRFILLVCRVSLFLIATLKPTASFPTTRKCQRSGICHGYTFVCNWDNDCPSM